MRIKEMTDIVEKYKTVTPLRETYLTEAIAKTTADWAGLYSKQVPVMLQAIAAAGAAGLPQKGARRRGTAGWKARCAAKIPGRYGPGVAAGAPDYETNFAPYHAVIRGLPQPVKGPRGAVTNYEIVKTIGMALHAKRMGTTVPPTVGSVT